MRLCSLSIGTYETTLKHIVYYTGHRLGTLSKAAHKRCPARPDSIVMQGALTESCFPGNSVLDFLGSVGFMMESPCGPG